MISDDFEPTRFLDEVTSSFDDILIEEIERLKEDLIQNARAKELAGITRGDIDNACSSLLAKLKKSSDQNMDKFDLYARRNVFRKPSEGSSSIESIMPRLEDSSAHAADLRELNALRLSYSGLLRTNSNLSAECRDADILVHDMRESLFKLRVGAQVLEETNLPEALASTAQSRDVLRALTERSIDCTARLNTILEERRHLEAQLRACTSDVHIAPARILEDENIILLLIHLRVITMIRRDLIGSEDGSCRRYEEYYKEHAQ